VYAKLGVRSRAHAMARAGNVPLGVPVPAWVRPAIDDANVPT
jgi:hypothetical protein